MKISASVYSNKSLPLSEVIRELDQCGIDYFHIDCLDDLSVFDDIAKIRQWSSTPIDLHIISSEPQKFVEGIKEHKVDFVAFQHEDLLSPNDFPGDLDCRLGIAFTTETSLDAFEHYKDYCDFVMMMTTVPGKSGGRFQSENFRRVRKFRSKHPHVRVHVDGGVNPEVSFILRTMGVNAAVSGSYLINATSIGAALFSLKAGETASPYYVKDFMLTPEEFPVLEEKSASLESVLAAIERYRMGFCMLTGENGELSGLVSNADLRRGVLRKIDSLEDLNLQDIINRKPVFIHEDRDVHELLKLIKSKQFPILYLPVTNHRQQLIGTVTFNNLIKGEL